MSKTNRLTEKEIRFVATRCGGVGDGELDEGSQKVQTSNYKINKYLGCNVQYDDYIYCCIIYRKVVRE